MHILLEYLDLISHVCPVFLLTDLGKWELTANTIKGSAHSNYFSACVLQSASTNTGTTLRNNLVGFKTSNLNWCFKPQSYTSSVAFQGGFLYTGKALTILKYGRLLLVCTFRLNRNLRLS